MRTEDPNNRRLASEIAASVAAMLEHGEMVTVPSASALARTFAVSRHTMGKVLSLLEEQGVVRLRHHTRPVRATDTSWPGIMGEVARAPSTQRLYDTIAEGLLDGRWPTGASMPKYDYFRSNNNVSNRTVAKVYALLCEKGLIHRRGRQFFAGSGNVDVRLTTSGTMLLIQAGPRAWRSLREMMGASAFCQRFDDECDRNSMRIVTLSASAGPDEPSVRSWDPSDVAATISSLGERYRGALIVGLQNQFTNFSGICAFLARYQKPIVWFDRIGEGCDFKRKTFCRATFDEPAVVDSALSHLSYFGHRRILFPTWHSDPWLVSRRQIVLDRAPEHGCTVRVTGPLREFTSRCVEPDGAEDTRWLATMFERLEQFPLLETLPDSELRLLLSGACKDSRQLEAIRVNLESDERVRAALFFSPILDGEGFSAVLAPNDWHGRKLFVLLQKLGLSYPGPISVVSIDNERGAVWYPMSSVDAGFGDLGYRVYHLIADSALHRAGGSRVLTAKPFVVDRGSVGRQSPPQHAMA